MDENALNLKPCIQIKSRIDFDRGARGFNLNNKDNDLLLSFKYHTEHAWYKKITNKREFSVETLFGQIGGFTGMNICVYFHTRESE